MSTPVKEKSTPARAKATPSKEKATPSKEKATPSKEKANVKAFGELSMTENKLLVLANYYHETNAKIDFEKIAGLADLQANSARTIYRSGKRKVAKMFLEPENSHGDADVSSSNSPVGKTAKGRAKVATPRSAKKAKLTEANGVAEADPEDVANQGVLNNASDVNTTGTVENAEDDNDSGIDYFEPRRDVESKNSGIATNEPTTKAYSEDEFDFERRLPGEPTEEEAIVTLFGEQN